MGIDRSGADRGRDRLDIDAGSGAVLHLVTWIRHEAIGSYRAVVESCDALGRTWTASIHPYDADGHHRRFAWTVAMTVVAGDGVRWDLPIRPMVLVETELPDAADEAHADLGADEEVPLLLRQIVQDYVARFPDAYLVSGDG